MTHSLKAMSLFAEGYNCAQSVALAFADEVDIDRDTLSKLACSFGGGMGRMREVCGAFSGALLILGLKYGYADHAEDVRTAQYERVKALGEQMKEKCGSLICRDLFEADITAPEAKNFKDAAPHAYGPCMVYVRDVAAMLEAFIEKQEEKAE